MSDAGFNIDSDQKNSMVSREDFSTTTGGFNTGNKIIKARNRYYQKDKANYLQLLAVAVGSVFVAYVFFGRGGVK